jgi:hypothetical protein
MPDATIVVDSGNNNAFKADGNGTSISAQTINVVGGDSIQSATVQGTLSTDSIANFVPDPLLNLPAPSAAGGAGTELGQIIADQVKFAGGTFSLAPGGYYAYFYLALVE